MRFRFLAVLLLVVLLLAGCADVTLMLEMKADGRIAEKQLRFVTDERMMLNMFLSEAILPMYEEWREEGHNQYIFLEIDDTSPPYRAEVFFDYDRARSQGFREFMGFWPLIEDYGLTADGKPYVRYYREAEGENSASGMGLGGAASVSIVTRMPSDILDYGRGFVSRDGRLHTVRLSFEQMMEDGFQFEVVAERPGWW